MLTSLYHLNYSIAFFQYVSSNTQSCLLQREKRTPRKYTVHSSDLIAFCKYPRIVRVTKNKTKALLKSVPIIFPAEEMNIEVFFN